MAPSLDFQTSISSVVLPWFREANLLELERVDILVLGRSMSDDEDNNLKDNNNIKVPIKKRYSLEETVLDFSNLSPTTTKRKIERAKSAPLLSESIHSMDDETWHNSFPRSYHNGKNQMPKSRNGDESLSRNVEDEVFAFENDKGPN
jgi:hypothetical protein